MKQKGQIFRCLCTGWDLFTPPHFSSPRGT